MRWWILKVPVVPVVLVALGVSVAAGAQSRSESRGHFAGSVASGDVTAEPVRLTLSEAVGRGLASNLGALAVEQQVEGARGARRRSLSDLLPRVDVRTGELRETTNLAAFGFDSALFPGIPPVVGPFNVFDARLYAIQPVFDRSKRYDLQRTTHALEAAQFEAQDARDLVVLVVTNLYLQAVAGATRIEAVRSEVQTAQSLLKMATDLRNAGAAPGIDVVRAQVQLQAQRQRAISAENDFAKRKLQLARAIGIPVAQGIELTDKETVVPAPALTVDAAIAKARESRADYRAALERLRAAEAGMEGARAESLPSVHVSADWGAIGARPSDARQTYALSGNVRVPIFDASRQGRVMEHRSTFRTRQDEAADFAQRVEAEVRAAYLDVQAAEQQQAVATERVSLARQELSLARTRFSAGVTSNLEVIQAQNEVAVAVEAEVGATYAFNSAKAVLARTLGSPDTPTR